MANLNSNGTSRRLVFNLPLPNANRLQGNIGRVVHEMLPELETSYMSSESSHMLHMQTPESGDHMSSHNSSRYDIPLYGSTNHEHSHSELPHVQGDGHPHLSPADNNFPPSHTIVNLGPNIPNQNGGLPDENQNTPAGQNTNQRQREQANLQLRTIWKFMEGTIPFLLLIFAKVMYDHRLGILVFLGLFITFYLQNTRLKTFIAQRESQQLTGWNGLLQMGYMAGHMVVLGCTIGVVYYVDDHQIYKCLLLQLPGFDHVDVWNLLWCVGLTDFVIKFGTIILKASLAMLPRLIVPQKKRGKYYMLLEHLSHCYRTLIPITPWVYFLLEDKHGGQWFSIILLVIYTICKAQQLLYKGKELRKAFSKFKLDVSYGSCPSSEDLKEADNTCPICQDKFTDPVKLTCKHVFCEDCVAMWFDRERTCPMCRRTIVDNPIWRDGCTSGAIQLY